MKKRPKITLTIAGNDASGGAGIAADLKTFAAYGTFGIATLTAIATMNPNEHWRHYVTNMDIAVVQKQLQTATAGPRIAALKTGMLPTVPMIELIAKTIQEHKLTNIVIDPVMVCKGREEILNPENAVALRDILIPLATVTTPNLFEASQLSGISLIDNIDGMKSAARIIYEKGAKCVVVKGGKSLQGSMAIDLFYDGKEFIILETPKIESNTNHGAGCTFAAAVTAGLAQGMTTKDSILKAKKFVTSAIQNGFRYNQYVGPVFQNNVEATILS